MAEERDGRRRAREMAWREPMAWSALGVELGVGLLPFVVGAAAATVALSSATDSSPPFCEGLGGRGGRCCELWTSQGSQPPGACVIFALSRPSNRGIEGPVRSMSRMPTDLPARERESAS